MTKIVSLIGLLTLATLSGCATRNDQAEVYQNRDFNFLGIVKVEPQSFASTPSHTLLVRSEELIPTNDFSGDRVTLLWGLFTFTDY